MSMLRHSGGTRIFRSRLTFSRDLLLQSSPLPPEEVHRELLTRHLPMTPLTGSRWNPRRPLAVLATLSASVLIGSTYGATAGFASPQLPIQDGISVSLVSDPTPLGNCVRRPGDPAPPAAHCAAGISTFSKHQQGPPACPSPAHGIETSPLLLRSAYSLAPAPAASPPGLVEASRSAPASPAGATAHCAAGNSSFNPHRPGPPVSGQPTSQCIVSRSGLINPTVPVC